MPKIDWEQLAEQEQAQAPPTDPKPKVSLKLPIAAMIAGNGLDVGSTIAGLNGGLGEANPILGDHPHPLTLVGVKAASMIPAYFLMQYLRDNDHPNWAKAVGFMSGGAGAGAGIHNLLLLNKHNKK